MQEADEKIDHERLSGMVQFLLHSKDIPPDACMIKLSRLACMTGIGNFGEFREALAVIVHLAREMVRLERIDCELSVADGPV
jgi:hypothetical protein